MLRDTEIVGENLHPNNDCLLNKISERFRCLVANKKMFMEN